MALIHIKSQRNEVFSDDPAARGESPDRTPPVDIEAENLEGVLRNLSALLEKHHAEWLALPQPQRREAVLRVLRNL